MLRRLVLTCGLILLLVPLAAGKQGKGRGKDHEVRKGGGVAVAVHIFAGPDMVVLREYHAKGSRGSLPPGLAKQLVRKGHLPPGLEKKLVSFPAEIERRLSPLEPGYQRGFIGGHAVIFNSSTRVILDVFVPLD